MNTRYNLTVLGGALFLSILISTGIFVYAQWDLNRFKASLRELPESGTFLETGSQRDIIITEHLGHIAPSGTVMPEPLENHLLDPEVPKAVPEEPLFTEADMLVLESGIDEPPFSELELPDLASEEPVEGIDYTYSDHDISSPTDFLKSAYGDSEDVNVIDEVLRRSETGTVTTNNMISMAEALLRIIPDDQPENRRSVMNMLEGLSELKRHELETGVTTAEVSITYSVAK